MRILGNILIFIGIVILLSLLVLSEYHFKADYFHTIQYKGITFGGEKGLLVSLGIIEKGEKIVISCKYIFIGGVLILISGVYAIALQHNPKVPRR